MNLVINLVKTRPPQYTAKLIKRDCFAFLQEAIEDQQVKVTLLEAMAGAGKSTLLQQLYQQLVELQQQVAWLSLSEHERDPMAFIAGIASALQSQGTHVGSASLALLQAGAGIPVKTILTTLFNEIFAYQHPITLFLDDLQLIEQEDIQILLQDILDNSPENLRLVIGTRIQPKLNIIKMQSRGQLRHFKSEDIRASLNDSQRFFNEAYDLNMDDEDLHTLVNRTDGWMNGLQIAALALRQRVNKKAYLAELSGSQKNLSDYIDVDIFQQLDAELQAFLVDSSVLEMISAPLCDAIRGKKDSLQLIEQLTELNLFIIPLDENHQWFRYHHLFSEFLKKKLVHYPDSEIYKLHEKAYKWCLKNHMHGAAVAHAITCQDWQRACDGIAACRLEFMIRNQISTLQLWIGQLPEAVINNRPILLLTLGWYHAMTRQFSLANEYLSKVDKLLQTQSFKQNLAPSLQNDLRALKGVIAINRGDPTELFSLSRVSDSVLVDNQDIFDSAYTSSAVYAHVFSGRFDKAHRLAIEMQVQHLGQNIVAIVYSYIFRGWAYRQVGDLKNAQLQYAQAGLAARGMLADKRLDFPVPDALQMELHYEWNDLPAATRLCPNLVELAKESATIEAIVCGYITSSRLAFVNEKPQQALQILAQGEALAKQEACHLAVVSMLAERVRLLLSMNSFHTAQQTAHELFQLSEKQPPIEQSGYWLDQEYLVNITQVRLEIVNEQIDQGVPLISALIEKAQQQQRHFPLVQLCILKSILLNKTGKEKHALKYMAEAIHYGSNGGMLRSFLDAPSEAHSVISECLVQWDTLFSHIYYHIDPVYISTLRNCFSISEYPQDIEYDLPTELEPLTTREQELLRHLSAGLKNKQLAKKLSLSENTIAWHLKNLYGKLGVSNRTSAVNVARKLYKL